MEDKEGKGRERVGRIGLRGLNGGAQIREREKKEK